MPRLSLNGRRVEVELIVFDKDGTLIDFHHLWGQRVRRGVDALVRQAAGGAQLRSALYRSLGYEPSARRAAGDGPLAVTSMTKLYTIAAAVLYQHGLGWEDAERQVAEVFAAAMGAPLTPACVRPLGDVAGLFRRLRAAGGRIALATSDERAATAATLALLGIETEVEFMICGDDPVPDKPAPEVLWRIGAALNVTPEKMMMVGDTASDMTAGAHAGCRVGVLSGAGDRATLSAHADVVLDSINDIQIESQA